MKQRFSCHCSHGCDKRVTWFACAPLSECYPDGEPCRCECHARAEQFDVTRREIAASGRLVDGYYIPLAYTGEKRAAPRTEQP